jgi:hypothetical protein
MQQYVYYIRHVCLFACNNSKIAETILIKFNTGNFY